MQLPVATLHRPSVLNGRANGRLPASILTTVPGQAGGVDIQLVTPAARSFKAMAAAALDAKIVLKVGWATNAYRPYADQERIFRQRYYPAASGVWWNGQRWQKRNGYATAAVPGTSNHGWGLAVDLGEERDGDYGTEAISDAAVRWLVANAYRFGFSAELQSEPWHWRYVSGDAIPAAVLRFEQGNGQQLPTPPPPLPTPSTEEDDDMGMRLEVHHDPTANKTFAMYGPPEKPFVDLYAKPQPLGAELSPGGYYIVRDAVNAGRMVPVGNERFT